MVHKAGKTLFATIAIMLVWSSTAVAAPLTPLTVFADAGPLAKLILLGLLAATLGAVIIAALKLTPTARLSGGSAYLSGLRVGGPLAGLLGAAWSGFHMALGIANVPGPVPANVLAHGAAEVMLLLVLGLLSGAVAVVGHWALEARIDRAVLSP